MPLAPKLVRLSLAAVLFASLGACTVVPVHPVGYRAPPPVYVESYPTYRYGYPGASVYYESGHRRYDNRGGNYYRDENRSVALRRWRAPPGHIATSGAAWVCPACRACRDELLLSPFGRQQHAFDTELLEPGLGGFSFLTGPERSDLNAGFKRGRNTAQEQLDV